MLTTPTPRIGLLVGREQSFPSALLTRIQKTTAVEFITINLDTFIPFSCPYTVILDRISHDVPCYIPYLKLASLSGCIVINPITRHLDDKFFDTAVAQKLGIRVPKTVLVPSKSYSKHVSSESLRNLSYPLDWDGLVAEIGLPMYLKDVKGAGWNDVYKVESKRDLWKVYDSTGELTLMAQENVDWYTFVRCIVIGDEVFPALWDPRLPHHERYTRAKYTLPAISGNLSRKLCSQAHLISKSLGYTTNSIEFAVTESGDAYAIDMMNSTPDFDELSLGPELFWWVVDRMAKVLIACAERSGDGYCAGEVWRLWNCESGGEKFKVVDLEEIREEMMSEGYCFTDVNGVNLNAMNGNYDVSGTS